MYFGEVFALNVIKCRYHILGAFIYNQNIAKCLHEFFQINSGLSCDVYARPETCH